MALARRFGNLSIRQKLTTTNLLTSGFALLAAAVTPFVIEYRQTQTRLTQDASVAATILADNTAAALDFDDKEKADRLLQALKAQPQIIRGFVFDLEGKVFARYADEGASQEAAAVPVPRPAGIYWLNRRRMHIFRDVRRDERLVGTVCVEADLRDATFRQARRYALFLVATIPAALAVSLFLTRRLQPFISGPILHLASVATQVRRTKDFSARAVKQTGDELGIMIDGFNEMLEEIQKRDAELTVARDRAEEANRAKSAFLANMSHELRTPLNAILGYSEMLIEDAEGAEDTAQQGAVPDLQRINTAGKQLLTLINDILDLAKIEAGKVELVMESFDLRQLTAEVVMTIEPLTTRNGNRLREQYGDDLGTMHADLTRVRQILLNLLSNASKFTERGEISLKITREPMDSGDWITFDVGDTGIGLSEDQIARLFQPFSQAHGAENKKYGGTGLGLVISRRLAAIMGGAITVRSTPGAGTTFTVRLPADVRSADTNVGSRVSATLDGVSRPCVLIVDADGESRRDMAIALRDGGFTVHEAGDASEALKTARQVRPAVVTLDVALPQVDGWSLLRTMKADPALSRTPVIVLTPGGARELAGPLGAADCLVKPIDPARLLAVIQQHMGATTPRTVLIVEDEMSTRSVIRRCLEKANYSVSEAENGRMALALLERWTPQLILLDLVMPEMDGFELVSEVRRRPTLKRIPIVVITSKDMTTEDYLRLEGRVEKVLLKGTYSRTELLKALRETMATPTAS